MQKEQMWVIIVNGKVAFYSSIAIVEEGKT
jgi:hypothetical protein